jgi:hypothetical protein
MNSVLIRSDEWLVLLAVNAVVTLLLDDLRMRTGLPIKRAEIGRINFLNDTAELRVFYDEARALRWRRQDLSLAEELYMAVDKAYT